MASAIVTCLRTLWSKNSIHVESVIEKAPKKQILSWLGVCWDAPPMCEEVWKNEFELVAINLL